MHHSPLTAQERGDKARDLWENEVFSDARQAVRQAILDTWATSPVADKEGQHELRLMLKLLNDLEANIQRVLADGQMAKVEIQRSTAEKARRMIRGYL
jgi:hypothetical protein